jgi:drug/metabolite transporter (DMT)-like permease
MPNKQGLFMLARQYYKKTVQASLLIAISGILYGFLGYLGTTILREDISISTMLFWRFFIAAGWILLFILVKHAKASPNNYPTRRNLLNMFMLGAIGYAGCSGFYFLSSEYIGTGLAMVIFFSYPIMVALGSWMIHRHKLSPAVLLTLTTMTVGLFLLRDSAGDKLNWIGIVFGLINASCYAFYLIGSKHLSTATIDSNVFTVMVCVGSAAIFLLLSLTSHTFVIPVTFKSWIYLLALGILATAVPIQLMLEGLRYVSSVRASIISVLEPLVTVIVGVILLAESITSLQILGAILILGSTLLIQFNREL